MAGPVYDSGLPKAQRTLIRAAIARQLSPLLLANGMYVRAIKHLPRPLKDGGEEEVGWISMMVQGQCPCILIALGRSKLESTGMDIRPVEVRANIDVAIYVCSNSARNYIDGRMDPDVVALADGTKDPGIETMLEHVEQYVLGESFDLETGLVDGGLARAEDAPRHVTSELDFEYEDEIATNGDFTIWEIRGYLKVGREINPDRALTQKLLDIYGKHSIAGEDPANPVTQTDATLEA